MKTVRIHRHPDCPRCARIVRMHHRLDWLGRIEDTTAPARSGALRMGEIVVEDLRTGRLLHGADAVEAILRAVPLYWPLLPLLAIPAVRRRADADARGEAACACEVPVNRSSRRTS
jgi:predicted DCC family thiol-disulfide oxidoreductase YuxK